MRDVNEFFVFPNAIVKHPKLGMGIVSHHEKMKDAMVTMVMWDDGEISVAPKGTVLIESSKPSKSPPPIQQWVVRRRKLKQGEEATVAEKELKGRKMQEYCYEGYTLIRINEDLFDKLCDAFDEVDMLMGGRHDGIDLIIMACEECQTHLTGSEEELKEVESIFGKFGVRAHLKYVALE